MNTNEEIVLSVDNLSKRYCRDLRRSLWYGVQDIFGELRRKRVKAQLRRDEFWALQNVSFELKRGESLAIIGANGAGKSTLLKILTGLVKPDAGEVRLRGRVGSIIELGTGFNPILTGRENISVYAAICGFTRAQIEPLIEPIVEFAELRDALETPVQYYSSGMKARLAFAVTAWMKPDVLLVDEVLAVGDINFQRKCVNRILSYLEGGGSLVFVSHSPFQIQSICQRGLLLEGGRATFAGNATETLGRYFESRLQAMDSSEQTAQISPTAEQPVTITKATIETAMGDELRTGEPTRLTLRYRALHAMKVFWGFSFWTGDGWMCITGDYCLNQQMLTAGEGELNCLIPRLPLLAGTYQLKFALIEPRSLQAWDTVGWHNAPKVFSVKTTPNTHNNICMGTNQTMTIDVEWQ